MKRLTTGKNYSISMAKKVLDLKKTISVLIALIMLITSFSVCGITAQAATRKNAPVHKVGDKFTLHLYVTKDCKVSTDWDHAYYAKFKPEKDGDYEFHTSWLEFYDYVCYKAMIVDAKDNVISYAYALGEDSFYINIVGHLKAGRTYYYLVQYYNDNYEYHKFDIDVTIKKHKHQMINTAEGCPDAEHMYDIVDENGNGIDMCRVQGCSDSGLSAYYNRFEAESAKKRMTYDGKAKEPKLRFIDMRGREFTPDYSIKTKYVNNVNIGTATIKYYYWEDWHKVKFSIVPKGTQIGKVTSKRRGFKVKWNKQSTQTTGYQLQYSKYKNFKSPFKVTVKGNKNTSYTAKKLHSGRKYYVRVRTYKTVDGKKYYSKWSDTKTVKAK